MNFIPFQATLPERGKAEEEHLSYLWGGAELWPPTVKLAAVEGGLVPAACSNGNHVPLRS